MKETIETLVNKGVITEERSKFMNKTMYEAMTEAQSKKIMMN